jgi:hypothetical protein
MSHDNRKWVIVNNSAVTDEMISAAIQTSRSTLRHTITGTDKVILKWDGDTPDCFDGMTTYNHSQILTELATSAWTRSE